MIYFMQPIAGGPVKIGYSANVDVRREQLEAHYGQPLAILAVTEGERQEEREMHKRFAHLRLGRTEQFRPAADLMAFIGRPLLVDLNPDVIEAMPPVRHTAMMRVDAETLEKVKLAASLMRMSVADYSSEVLRKVAERDIQREAKKLTGGTGE